MSVVKRIVVGVNEMVVVYMCGVCVFSQQLLKFAFHFTSPWHVIMKADDGRDAVLISFTCGCLSLPLGHINAEHACIHSHVSVCLPWICSVVLVWVLGLLGPFQILLIFCVCVFVCLRTTLSPHRHALLSVHICVFNIQLKSPCYVMLQCFPCLYFHKPDQIYCPYCSSGLTGRDVIKNGLHLSLHSHSFSFSK